MADRIATLAKFLIKWNARLAFARACILPNFTLNLNAAHMSKGQDKKKEEKKKPQKTMMEKRAEKRAKKEGRQ